MPSNIPGGSGKVYLNKKGMRELLKSTEIRAELVERMIPVQSALAGSKLEVVIRPTRVVVTVTRGSDFDEANTGDLSRALDLARGRRGRLKKFAPKSRRKSSG